jgi:GNAT superfamily N-acetyltransferase
MTIRPAREDDAGGIATVHVRTWQSTYAGMVPAEYLATLSIEQRERAWQDRLRTPNPETCAFVAEAPDGAIVGFATGGPRREGPPDCTSELYAIYLLPGWQGQGTGRRLALAVAGWLAENGHESLLVWVLAQNPACRFYEALGGRYRGEQSIEIGGASLVEVVYGWEDIHALLQGGPHAHPTDEKR